MVDAESVSQFAEGLEVRFGPARFKRPDGPNRYSGLEGEILLGDELFGTLGLDEVAEVVSKHGDFLTETRDRITVFRGRVGNFFSWNYRQRASGFLLFASKS